MNTRTSKSSKSTSPAEVAAAGSNGSAHGASNDAATSATNGADRAANVSAKAESALPTVAAVPSRIAGERPTTGVPFTRLVRVELRKMLDTRAGRWLLIGIGLIIAITLVIMFFNDGGKHPLGDYLQATLTPQAIILPVVGILAVTSEWSQRTGLVTFSLEPRRMRVAAAKFVAAMIVGVSAIVLSIVLAVVAHQAAITLRGYSGDWTLDRIALFGGALYVLLGMAQGVGFGMLFKNTPAAIVVYFVLPSAWAILGQMVSWLHSASQWLNLNETMLPLFNGSLTGQQWAQLGSSVALWVVLPLVLGLWRLNRAEVK